MSRRCRGCLIGAALTIELSLGRPVAANDGMPSVLLYLANEAGVSSDIVGDARQEVIRIYAQIGVRVIWTEHVTGSPKDPLVIIIPPITGQWVGPTSLGLALRGANSSGRLAYVFYDRVQPLARKHQMSDASLLGVAIAHEIGHLLPTVRQPLVKRSHARGVGQPAVLTCPGQGSCGSRRNKRS